MRQVRNTSLIEIRVFSEIPAEAREIAQKIAEVYRDNRLNAKRSMSAGGIKKLQEKLETHEKNIREKQKVVEAIRKDTGITLITPKARALTTPSPPRRCATSIPCETRRISSSSKRTPGWRRYGRFPE